MVYKRVVECKVLKFWKTFNNRRVKGVFSVEGSSGLFWTRDSESPNPTVDYSFPGRLLKDTFPALAPSGRAGTCQPEELAFKSKK